VGYGPNPPVFEWPGGNRLAINLVVNYEEGSEYSYAFGDERQEHLGEWGVKQFPPGVRNLANESFFEYGSRVGVWRLLDLFDRHAVPVTFGVCAVALERNGNGSGWRSSRSAAPPAGAPTGGTVARRPAPTHARCWSRRAASCTTPMPTTTTFPTWSR
jgi:hypothetical protein